MPVVIENRVGGSGMVAGAYVARSEPTGYTLLVTSSANMTNPQRVTMPYDVVADFAPVGMILEGPALILITNPTLPFKSVPELIAYGKANPGKLGFGSSGSGTVNALAIAQLSAEAGIEIVDVPYRGITQAGIAVVAGEIEGAFVFQGAARPLVAEGKARGLADRAAARSGLAGASDHGREWVSEIRSPGLRRSRRAGEDAAGRRCPAQQARE